MRFNSGFKGLIGEVGRKRCPRSVSWSDTYQVLSYSIIEKNCMCASCR